MLGSRMQFYQISEDIQVEEYMRLNARIHSVLRVAILVLVTEH